MGKNMGKKIAVIARDFVLPGNDRAYQMLIEEGYEVKLLNDNVFMDEDQTIDYCQGADGIIVSNNIISDKVISGLPDLKIISRRGVGLDAIDMESAARHHIEVTRTLGKVEKGVAELVMAYIMEFGRHVTQLDQDMKNGTWDRILMPGLEGRTLGLIGFGGIGKNIAKMAQPFGFKIIYYNRHPDDTAAKEYGAVYAPLEELLEKSDYVSVNIPLTEQTKNFITMEQLKKMKPNAVLINIARSQVVSDTDLAQALKDGIIAGAAVDVYKKEPCTDSVLRDCPNAILTPHIGPFTEQNFSRVNETAADNLIQFFRNNDQ